MKKKIKVAGVPGLDPTMPLVEIELAGEKYFLAFSFGAMTIAQKRLREIGYECNLLQALDLRYMDAEKFIPLLYSAMIIHQPEIAIDKVADLVTLDNFGQIFSKLVEAYAASIAKPTPEDKENPTQPVV